MRTEDIGVICDSCLLLLEGDNDNATDTELADFRAGIRDLGGHLHSGDEIGFSRCQCAVCRSPYAGNRHELFQLVAETAAA